MRYFEWNTNYATGIREIDTQHAYLFALTNRFMLHAAGNTPASELRGVLEELRAYVAEHFSFEESLMKQARYRFLVEHQEHHARLRAQLEQFVSDLLQGALSAEELIDFLKTWITMHIMREDMKYIPAIARFREAP